MGWMTVGALALVPALGLAAAPAYPRVDHVVVVIEENHAFSQIIGARACPYINHLADGGALLTRSYAVTHPSEPNYLALFAGRTFGLGDDRCPPAAAPYDAPNLASALAAVGARFAGYSEGLPSGDPTACRDEAPDGYRRKHNPWVDFRGLAPDANLGFAAFPNDVGRLPQVAYVVPDLEHDMHNGTRAQGDAWLRDHLAAYARWCRSHAGVLVVTFDEDNGVEGNRIPTLVYGRPVRRGRDGERVDHWGLLATLCKLYGASAPGRAARARPLARVFR